MNGDKHGGIKPGDKLNQKLLTIPEFAKALSITPACVRRWLFERKIAKVKLGRLVRIPSTEVDRMISLGLCPARPAPSVPPPLQPIVDAAEAWLRGQPRTGSEEGGAE